MEPGEYIQINTTLHVPAAMWQAWCVCCVAQGQDPIATFNRDVGPVVEALLRGVPTLVKDV